jgi:broad specificity phosphatase PhoE
MSTTNHNDNDDDKKGDATGKNENVIHHGVRPSIKLYMIRHAESRNNEIYRDARLLCQGGTPSFDVAKWEEYIQTHRTADPGLSTLGIQQSHRLAEYLVPYLSSSSSQINIITSPMKRTCDTIRPTILGLLSPTKVESESSSLTTTPANNQNDETPE